MEKLLDYTFYVLLGYDYSVKYLGEDEMGNRQWIVRVEERVLLVLNEHDIAALRFLRDHIVEDQESIDRYDEFFSQLSEE